MDREVCVSLPSWSHGGKQTEQLHRNTQEEHSKLPYRAPACPKKILRIAKIVCFSFILYGMHLQKCAAPNYGCPELEWENLSTDQYFTLEFQTQIPQKDNTI